MKLTQQYLFSLKALLIGVLCLVCFYTAEAQNQRQLVTGVVTDLESHQPLSGVFIQCVTSKPMAGCATDSLGHFKMLIPLGRHTFSFSHIGYAPEMLNDILVSAGKQVVLDIGLDEQIYQTDEVDVKASNNRWLNPMATVSARTLSSQDAARYAAGYFDASRMVTNFAGVASGNDDDNNELIIRGNSPRGVLWRIEGIEIPNPNHFTNGQGSSGGAYSTITTNVLSSFDFFTGSFPAEYGNAYSGVMDLNLKTGNETDYEFSAAAGVLGAELSAEGPIAGKKGSSFLFNFRKADFKYLAYLGIIDDNNYSVVPKSTDYAFKTTLKTNKLGIFDIFSVGGDSRIGDKASSSVAELKAGGDADEFLDRQSMAVAGVKHSFAFPDNKTYLRTTLAMTYEFTSSRDQKTDTLLRKTTTYYDRFEYPALRLSSMFNHKINATHSLRAGYTFNRVWGDMYTIKLLSGGKYDTLMNAYGSGWYGSLYAQWKYRPNENLEMNAGVNTLISGITREVILEPRWGMILRFSDSNTMNFGLGFHSRIESLSIYRYRVKIAGTNRSELNRNLKAIKAFHFTVGWTHNFSRNLYLNMEAYVQDLYSVPINENPIGQYSILNSLGGLPDVNLTNKGKGGNVGLETTLEKSLSRKYYFLATASLFDSRYLAPDGQWYNTYFNTSYVYNLIGGKEFALGKHQQNTLGLKFRSLARGGFRYTPVNTTASVNQKKLVYLTSETYGKRLPAFHRFDFGVSYRINRSKSAWSLMADVQNVLNTKNVLRQNFQYKNKQVITYSSYSIGMIPVFTVKVDF